MNNMLFLFWAGSGTKKAKHLFMSQRAEIAFAVMKKFLYIAFVQETDIERERESTATEATRHCLKRCALGKVLYKGQ